MNEHLSEKLSPDDAFIHAKPAKKRAAWARGDKVNHPAKGPGTVRKVRDDGKLEVSFSFGTGVEVVGVGDCRQVSRDEY